MALKEKQKVSKIISIKNLPYAQNLLKPLAVLTLGTDYQTDSFLY